jgi:hypothetical protein
MPSAPPLDGVPAVLLERLLGLIHGPAAPSTNGDNGDAPPSTNGDNGRAAPSTNGDNGKVPQPSTNGRNGRDTKGRFARGNKGGPGNPFARRVASFRAAVCQEATADDFRELARLLVMMAKGGDLAAMKLLFTYTVGRPGDTVDPDTLDWQEWQMYQQTAATPEALSAVLKSVPQEVACTLIRAVMPFVAENMRQKTVEALGEKKKKK